MLSMTDSNALNIGQLSQVGNMPNSVSAELNLSLSLIEFSPTYSQLWWTMQQSVQILLLACQDKHAYPFSKY
jgi:hypothetical protein